MPHTAAPLLTESQARGRALRRTVPRSGHARLEVDDRDPVAILEQQNADRLPDLVPVRMGRMLQSPFAFFRGTATLMAHDLSTNPLRHPHRDLRRRPHLQLRPVR